MSWKIRFYTGLNQGIDVALDMGSVVLGSDPLRADLVLIDEGIAAVHLSLNVSEEAVILTSCASEIVPCQDGAILEAGHRLQPLACQQAGALTWAFCLREQAFPASLKQHRPAVPARARKRNPPKLIVCLMAGASLLLLMVFIALFSSELWPDKRKAQVAASIKTLTHFLQAERFHQVTLDTGTDAGALVLSGWLDDIDSRSRLQHFLQRENLPVRLDIRTQEEVKQQVDFIIQKLGYDQIVSFNGVQAGWIRLTGEVYQDKYDWPQIEALLKRDVPGLLGIENHVRVAAMAQAHLVRLEQLLASWGLKEQLSYRSLGERIELHGQLNDAQRHRFTLLQTEFNRDFAGLYTLDLIVPVKKQVFALSVRAISLGKVPYIVLSDNRKYPVGAMTPEGIRIIAIHGDRIVVNKNKQQYIVNIKGNEWHDDLVGRTAG